MTMQVPFNSPHTDGSELAAIQAAIESHHLSGNGPFTKRCQRWLETNLGVPKALLTQSCTSALEMAALLSGVGPGDEVIMPSFTFVSTANAFVLRGATPVFVDITPDTLNVDPEQLSLALTARTRAILPVHYAGRACEMEAIGSFARANGLSVIEDAAQGLGSLYRGRALGSIGDAAALSFHETKNVIAGEGGALLITRPDWITRAEILWEKGTNRAAFHRGEVDKYTWVDVGSSFLPSEITAAFLSAQVDRMPAINAERMRVWRVYHAAFADLEADGLLTLPKDGAEGQHNAHIFFLLYPTAARLDAALRHIRQAGVDAVRHYVPLHSSPAGRKYGRFVGTMMHTDSVAGRLLRLPLWIGMSDEQIALVIAAVRSSCEVDG